MATPAAPTAATSNSTETPPLLLVETEGAVRHLILNRPERKNALNRELVGQLGNALRVAASDDSVRVVVLRGAGGAFCSGADLRTMQVDDPSELEVRLDEFHAMIRAVVSLPQPVIAAVDGPAVGFGADLALACDLRWFSESSYIEESFVKIGLMPDGGGTFWLQRLIGAGRAFECLTLGSRLSAEECAQLGIANHVIAGDGLLEAVRSAAKRLALAAPLAIARIKNSLTASSRTELEAALAREKEGQLALLRSADFSEGVTAFLEKRAARFQGR